MELSNEFTENAILSEYIYEFFQNDDIDAEFFYEIHKMVLVDYDYEMRIINVIRNLQFHKYKQAREEFRQMEVANELENLRRVIKSLLKGLIATSEMAGLPEIIDAKIRWQSYATDRERFDPNGYHSIVYQEFNNVETQLGLERFNNYLHNFILDLIFATADIFIKRMSYTIEHLRDDKQLEEACNLGVQNFQKFKEELEELKSYKQ